ncbi:MAG TPA: hypothetical protein PKN12_00735 [Bacteroidales bacterium]|nr:hypothetical protein [Bacteroidales bacterium]HPT08845.1 hypothetical protein [Bacteroidales bacterium]
MKNIILISFLVWVLFAEGTAQTSTTDKSLVFFNKTEGGVAFGIGSFKTNVVNGIQKKARNDEIVVSLQTINGVKYLDRVTVGVSIGVEKWQNGLFWPVYAYLGYALKPTANSFFANIYLGYGFGTRYSTNFYEQGSGAFGMSIGVGYQMRISKKLRFLYEIFYRYQAVESTYFRINDIESDTGTYQKKTAVDYKVPLHFAGFKIGICFP